MEFPWSSLIIIVSHSYVYLFVCGEHISQKCLIFEYLYLLFSSLFTEHPTTTTATTTAAIKLCETIQPIASLQIILHKSFLFLLEFSLIFWFFSFIYSFIDRFFPSIFGIFRMKRVNVTVYNLFQSWNITKLIKMAIGINKSRTFFPFRLKGMPNKSERSWS